jgi:hypothetical protein
VIIISSCSNGNQGNGNLKINMMSITLYESSRLLENIQCSLLWSAIFILLLSACSSHIIPGGISTPTSGTATSSSPYTILTPVFPMPTDVTIEVDQGKVCLYPVTPLQLRVTVGSAGCFSSSCTIVYERTGDMKIDQNDFTIQLTARFAAQNIAKPGESGVGRGCTADCGGAGQLEFQTGELPKGVYAVKLGDLKIGDLQIPAFPNSVQCFSSEATAVPYVTPLPIVTLNPGIYPVPIGTLVPSTPGGYP